MAAICAAIALSGPSAGATEAPGEVVPPPSRNVTPPGITPAPQGEGPLIREAVPPPPPEPPRWRRFVLPKTLDAGTFGVKAMAIRISGIDPPASEATCTAPGAASWPCGRSALHAFRMFLRGRAVECFFPYARDLTKVIAPCRVGDTDLGLWLLSQGWAKPGEGATDDYLKAADAARCDRRGLWRDEATDTAGCGD